TTGRPAVGTVLGRTPLGPRLLGRSAVLLDQPPEAGVAGSASREHVTGGALDLLDVHVRIHRDGEQVVGGIAGRRAVGAPVVREAHLVHDPATDPQRRDALGDHDAGLDRRPRADDGGPPAV